MKRNRTRMLAMAIVGMLGWANAASAQEESSKPTGNRPSVAPAKTERGPHGGTIRNVDAFRIETLVSQAGIECFVFNQAGKAISSGKARGMASVRIPGVAKRYRYHLMPNENGGLTAAVDLSKTAGKPLLIEIQLVGIPAGTGNLFFREVAAVPLNEIQFAAASIARQKVCPVSGKPLGSMGDPIGVLVNEAKVYVCCAGCVNELKANPARFSIERHRIVVSTATQADASAIASQKVCPVMDGPLGGMGTPVKVMVGDKPIYLCCKGCLKKVQDKPAKYLALVYPTTESVAR